MRVFAVESIIKFDTAVIYFTHGEPETYDPIGWLNQFREFDE